MVSAWLRTLELLFNAYGFYLLYVRRQSVCVEAPNDEDPLDPGDEAKVRRLLSGAHWITWIVLVAHLLLSTIFMWSLQAEGRSNLQLWEHGLQWLTKKMACLGLMKKEDVITLQYVPLHDSCHPSYLPTKTCHVCHRSRHVP